MANTNANNAVNIQRIIRMANAAGWSVVRKGKTYVAVKCVECGAPTALRFERSGNFTNCCFRCK